MVIGFANGAFDGLHDGHKHFLRECMMNCDRLLVGINNDLSVRRRKGEGRPINLFLARMRAVEEMLRRGNGDLAIGFETEGELALLIQQSNPSVLFKGEDYLGRAITGAAGIRIHWVARHPGYSTTLLAAK
jgi:D-beta-D-heptose 7-phosphate kinase/D-beta-D-heptose 1-phosphate adenosyltransferase